MYAIASSVRPSSISVVVRPCKAWKAAGFFGRHPTGDLMSRATSDLGQVRLMLGPGSHNLVNTFIAYAAVLKGTILVGWPRVRKIDYTIFTRGVLRWLTGLLCLALGSWMAWIGFAGGA